MTYRHPTDFISGDKLIKLIALFNHTMLVIGIVYTFSWLGLLSGYLVHVLICTIGISMGYHRIFAHKAFTSSPIREWIMLFFGSIACLGSVIGWAGIHRMHHAYSDTEKDPHSPLNGFWRSWLHVFKTTHIPPKFVVDLIRSPRLRLQHKWYFEFVLLYLVVGYVSLGWNAVWLISLPAVLIYHVTGIVNSVHHWYGDRVQERSRSTDIVWLNILTCGESYHGYHHHRPNSKYFGKWDFARLFMWMFETEKRA